MHTRVPVAPTLSRTAARDALRARAPLQPVRQDGAMAGNRVPALRPLDRVPRACSRGLRSRTHPSIAWEGLRDAGVSIAWEGLREAGVIFAGEADALRGRV
eukprot:7038571-Prymnesium_polylepis.1